jgi:hypothetical protein
VDADANLLRPYREAFSTMQKHLREGIVGKRRDALSVPLRLQPLLAQDERTRDAWALLSKIYEERADLQKAFPETSPDFPQTLLGWALTSGVTVDADANLLRPYREAFSTMQKHLVLPVTR